MSAYPLIPDAVPVLRGDRLVLRELVEADLDAWFSRLSDPEAATLAGDPVATSRQAVVDGLAYHRRALAEREGIRWSIVPDDVGASVGSIGLGRFDASGRSAEIGAAVGRAHWSRGIATAAGRLVIDYASDALALRRIDALVLERNARVRRVLEKLGFVRAGDVPPDREIGGAGNPSLYYSLALPVSEDKASIHVEIVDYRPSWKVEFEQIARVLQRGLGDLALAIDHIGSTSVPGLSAKDVIDVQVTVAVLDERVVAAIESVGYARVPGIVRDHRPPNEHGPDSDWQKLYFRPPPGQRRTHLHVRALGRPNQRYALLFRDFLTAHPDFAAAYGELKRRLAAGLRDLDDYPDVKDPACDLIYLAAKRWRAS